MKYVLIILLAMTLEIATCHAQKKKEVSTPVNVCYCLPKVVYDLNVTMECTRYIPGPYWKHAAKELGITPDITQAEERWRIMDIRITPRYVPDEKAVYSISADGEYTPVLLSLSGEGFLAGVAGGNGLLEKQEEGVYVADRSSDAEVINIMKLNTYNHLKEVLDTNYTFQEIDGEMKKIWDPIVRYVRKNEEDNIKEAVSEIFRIRSERVRLLAAENNVPDGQSLDIILKEFDRMEANYLSLFLGKKSVRTVKKTISCTPEAVGESTVAFRFSEKEGISDDKNVAAQPYSLLVEDVVIPASKPVGGEGEGQAIYYRVPASGRMSLLCGKEKLWSMPVVVPQLGEIKRFPIDVVVNEGLSLEFHSQYGSLKGVKRKN